MNIQVGREQKVSEIGVDAERLSEQIAYSVAPLMEVLGISSLRSKRDDTMTGVEYSMSEMDHFEGVPTVIARWAEPACRHICGLLSVFGVISMSIDIDKSDSDKLQSLWDGIVNSKSYETPPVRDWSVDPGYSSSYGDDGIYRSDNARPISDSSSAAPEPEKPEEIPEVKNDREPEQEQEPEERAVYREEPEILVL